MVSRRESYSYHMVTEKKYLLIFKYFRKPLYEYAFTRLVARNNALLRLTPIEIM